jgi:hypothetical protein
VPERSNGLAWKACVPQKGTEGSNPSPSAIFAPCLARRGVLLLASPSLLPSPPVPVSLRDLHSTSAVLLDSDSTPLAHSRALSNGWDRAAALLAMQG